MKESFALFGTSGFMPHGHCYLWQPEILLLHVGSDALIALAYFSIPVALVVLVRKRQDLVFNWIFLLFGGFIFLCGTTHLFSIFTTWQPHYGAEGLLKFATALISVGTAVAVWPLLPRALALPSTTQLEEANLRYRSLNEDLERRVERRTSTLEQRNADLERFASFLSHEFRQPLNTLLLNTELLSEEAGSDEDGCLDRIKRAGRQMAEMIEAELTLSRAMRDTGVPEEIDLEAFVRQIVAEFAQDPANRDASFEIESLPHMTANPTHLRQIFRNLIGNSLRYRRPGVAPHIRIVGEARLEDVWIEVVDNGRGFSSDMAEKLFEPFERGTSNDSEGMGIGLALCKRVIDRQGGEIHAYGAVDEGATFVFRLPRSPDGPGMA